ncbi:hypothetical protein LFM09_48030 [Lentzea alba]|uniref:hypothetical protein n=1 Tax=Lentzea alba TaxID=2714351 RepID=UPI0039BF7BDE
MSEQREGFPTAPDEALLNYLAAFAELDAASGFKRELATMVVLGGDSTPGDRPNLVMTFPDEESDGLDLRSALANFEVAETDLQQWGYELDNTAQMSAADRVVPNIGEGSRISPGVRTGNRDHWPDDVRDAEAANGLQRFAARVSTGLIALTMKPDSSGTMDASDVLHFFAPQLKAQEPGDTFVLGTHGDPSYAEMSVGEGDNPVEFSRIKVRGAVLARAMMDTAEFQEVAALGKLRVINLLICDAGQGDQQGVAAEFYAEIHSNYPNIIVN